MIKVGRPKSLESSKAVSIVVEIKEYEKFKNRYQRNYSDRIRELIREDNDKHEVPESLPCLSSNVRDTTSSDYLANSFNNILESSSEDLDQTLENMTTEKRERLQNKLLRTFRRTMIKQEEKEQESNPEKLSREEYREIQSNPHDYSPRLEKLRQRLKRYGISQ